MGRKTRPIYVNPGAYCHCPNIDCGNDHAIHDGVPNDDIARYRLVFSGGGDELYHGVEDAMLDLLGVGVTRFVPFGAGDALMVDLETGDRWDAAEFRDAHS